MTSRSVPVRLPEASPEDYVRLVGFWREVEARMLERPALADFAAARSAPFIRDEVSTFISHVLWQSVLEQSLKALRETRSSVSPVLRADPDLMRRSLEYSIRRGEWLMQPGILEGMGVEPLEHELQELRAKAIATVGDQLTSHASRMNIDRN